MANKMLKCHDIVYQNHLRTLRFKEDDAEEILVLSDQSGDKFFHYFS